MSSYFDGLAREVRLGRSVESAIEIERELVRVVSLVTGDREFPNDLREKIQGIIAVERIERPETNDRNTELFDILGSSALVHSLHSAFHEVASRRVDTRFGLLTDDPLDILSRRDSYDSGGGEGAVSGPAQRVVR